MNPPILATQAAAMLAGYALTIGQNVADRTRTAVSDRLFNLVRNKFTRRAGDARALENLMQEPANPRHQEVVAAALTDAINEDPRFGEELRHVVTEVKQAYGYVHQSGTAAGNQIIDQSVLKAHDQLRITRKRGAVAIWLFIGIAAGLAIAGTTTFVILKNNEPVSTSDTPKAKTRGRPGEHDLLLPTNPYEAVRRVYQDIAQGYAERACARFTDTAQEEFAGDFGDRSCKDAVEALEKQVTDKNDYAESMPSYKTEPITSDSIRISSCTDNIKGGIRGGPELGAFTVEKLPHSRGDQWIIAGHESEVC